MGIDRKREEEKRAKWLDRKWKREDIGVNVMGRINNRDTRGKCGNWKSVSDQVHHITAKGIVTSARKKTEKGRLNRAEVDGARWRVRPRRKLKTREV